MDGIKDKCGNDILLHVTEKLIAGCGLRKDKFEKEKKCGQKI